MTEEDVPYDARLSERWFHKYIEYPCGCLYQINLKYGRYYDVHNITYCNTHLQYLNGETLN